MKQQNLNQMTTDDIKVLISQMNLLDLDGLFLNISDWINDSLDSQQILSLPHDSRTQVIAGLLELTREYSNGIIIFIGMQQYGAAFTLIRPTCEALMRAVWAKRCATGQEMEDLMKKGKDKFPDFGNLARIFKTNEIPLLIDGKTWGVLCKYVHPGYDHIVRRLNGKGLGSNYSTNEIYEVRQNAILFQLYSGRFIAELTPNSVLVQEFKDITDALTFKIETLSSDE